MPIMKRLIRNLSLRLKQAPALRAFLKRLYHTPALKGFVTSIPIVRHVYPMERKDPIDIQYGINTSGVMPAEVIHPNKSLNALILPYAAASPAVVRASLAALGNIDDHVLIDLGCGKGRVTVLGSELPFLAIIGVELSPHLAKIAKKNANIIARNFPDRPPINIFEANATEFPFPKGNLVLFFYHAFGRELLVQLVRRLEFLLLSDVTHLFFVYDNPVCGDVLDASPTFIRWYANMLPHDPIGTNGESVRSDAVVIWQSVRDARPSPDQNRDCAIDLVDPLTAKLTVTAAGGYSLADAPA